MSNISFIPDTKYDKGRYPSIAVNSSGLAIEGHQREGDSKIFYLVGTAGPNMVEFGDSSSFDSGAPPKFAINDHNLAVEIHKSNGPSDSLWYHVGTVNPGNKTWDHGDSHKDGSGKNPDIALNNNNVAIAVFEDGSSVKYRVGSVDSKISFGDKGTVATAKVPSVAMTDSGKVVVVYQNDNQINYSVGQISGKTMSIQHSGNGPAGRNPTVGMTEDGKVVLAFSVDGNLYSSVGFLSGNVINWTTALQYGYGNNPWADAKGNYAVQANASDDFADYNLFASLSTFANRSTWMGDRSAVQALSLSQLVFPGSHDAGMSVSQQCTLGAAKCNTRTQMLNIGQQLDMGSRYFDIRPSRYKSEWFTGHYSDTPVGIQGCDGQSLEEILDQTSAFLGRTSREVVVLKFSHYYDKDDDSFGYSDTQLEDLITFVKEKLGNGLYINNTGKRLCDIPLSQITSEGSRVIAVFDKASSVVKPAEGIYSYADYSPGDQLDADFVVFDEYYGKNDLSGMEDNQWEKQEDRANHGGDLFLLSWTLTQSDLQAASCTVTWADSIVAISGKAESALYPQCIQQFESGKITRETIPNILYTDLSDGFAVDVAIYLNEQLAASSA